MALTKWDSSVGGVVVSSSVEKNVLTNTSGQIRSRVSFSDANVQLVISVNGYYDTRGRI